jgi:hypothetical protein
VELAKYSMYFEGTRLSHLKYSDSLPIFNSKAIVQCLPPESRFSLRTHPQIIISYSNDFQESAFILNKVKEVSLTLEGAELKLFGKNKDIVFLKGEEKLLKIIREILTYCESESWITIKEEALIPINADDFETKKQYILSTVSKLRIQIQELQTSIDSIVFKLYDIPENSNLN